MVAPSETGPVVSPGTAWPRSSTKLMWGSGTSGALTNVTKYAGADRVSVDVTATDGTLEVTVADDGAGGADAAKGSGLRGLVDRVTALGGRMDVSSPPGQGTRLSARLPVSVLATVHAQPATLL